MTPLQVLDEALSTFKNRGMVSAEEAIDALLDVRKALTEEDEWLQPLMSSATE